jgi:hypothetical protein
MKMSQGGLGWFAVADRSELMPLVSVNARFTLSY